MTRVSQSQLLRNVLFRVYEGLNSDYRINVDFNTFYEVEMTKIINSYKQQI